MIKLAYGKFDPEMNPKSFLECSKIFTAVEIDLFRYFSWKPKVTASFQSWVRKKNMRIIPRIGLLVKRPAAEYEDSLQAWLDLYEKKTLFFCVHSGRKLWSRELHLGELRKLVRTEKYFFEWGRDDSAKSVRFLSELSYGEGFVVDPDWHSFKSLLPKTSFHFKLHGWSEERWVRRYGEKGAAQISRSLKRAPKDSELILSYSGKIAEASLFREDYAKKITPGTKP